MVVTTEVDRLYEIIIKQKKISLVKVSKILNEKIKIVEEWAKTLEESKLISVEYSFNPFVRAYLKVVENAKKNPEKE